MPEIKSRNRRLYCMKVLFVSSGNNRFGGSPIVKNQGESIKKMGVDVEYYFIIGKKLSGYVKNIFRLRRFLKTNKFDLIHAHYSLSGMVASLSSSLPVVVSLMGSDIHAKGIMKLIFNYFCRRKWRSIIVKSNRMKELKHLGQARVIPNGVNFETLKVINKETARKKVGFNAKKHVIFVGNPARKEKNFRLAKQAFDLLKDQQVELNVVSGVVYKNIPYYYYAADVLLLTSLWEGSPNVVKEAMACNLPVVSTDVGDVKELISSTIGCYLTSFNPEDVAKKLKLALTYGKRTDGREKIKHLDSEKIARKIIKIYKDVSRDK